MSPRLKQILWSALSALGLAGALAAAIKLRSVATTAESEEPKA